MSTLLKYSRYLAFLILGAGAAQFAVYSGMSAYVTLLIGIVLLVYAKLLIKAGLLCIVHACTWYYNAKLPGYRRSTEFMNWLYFQLTATPEDRERLAESNKRRKAHEATVARQQELRERYKGTIYSEVDIADFFDRHAIEVACLVKSTSSEASSGSRFGGLPRLRGVADWPRDGETGQPLHFLAELHLSDVPRLDTNTALPRDGILMFFCDLAQDDWSAPTVLYLHETGEMLTPPDDLPAINHFSIQSVTRPADLDKRVMAEHAVMPLRRRIPGPQASLPEDVDRNLVNKARKHGEMEFAKEIEAAPDLVLTSAHYNHHLIGGPASEKSNPSSGYGFKLLQIDSDADLGLSIGGSGIIEFWIDESALAARRFDVIRLALDIS